MLAKYASIAILNSGLNPQIKNFAVGMIRLHVTMIDTLSGFGKPGGIPFKIANNLGTADVAALSRSMSGSAGLCGLTFNF